MNARPGPVGGRLLSVLLGNLLPLAVAAQVAGAGEPATPPVALLPLADNPPAASLTVDAPTANPAHSSAEELIEQVMQQRALKALLTEQLEVSRLRTQLRNLREVSPAHVAAAAGLALGVAVPSALPRVVALWEDAKGKVASVSAASATNSLTRRIHVLREGEKLATATGHLAVRHIGPEGVTVRFGEDDDDILLPY